jgi:hypothetical protein
MTTAETLTALDWTSYACQCPAHDCTDRAAFVVRVHAISACTRSGLDPGGNRVELRCVACVRRLQAEVRAGLRQLNWHGRASCDTCGAPLVAVGDVVRELVALS